MSIRLALKVYCTAAAAVLSVAALALLAGAATGRLSLHRIEAAREAFASASSEAAVRPAAAAPAREEGATAPEAAVPAGGAGGGRAPASVVREIERASEDLKYWEDRLDLLSSDLRERLVAVGRKDRTIQERQQAWDRVKKALVPLLNELLAESPGWRPITEEEFLAVVTAEGGSPAGADGAARPGVADLLERLRSREAAFAEASTALKGLAPEVLAGLVAAGLKDPSGGSFPGPASGTAGTALGEGRPLRLGRVEAARFLSGLEPSKLARVFKSLRDEDPEVAGTLLAAMLHGAPAGGGKEAAGAESSASAGGAPPGAEAAPAVGTAAKETGRAVEAGGSPGGGGKERVSG